MSRSHGALQKCVHDALVKQCQDTALENHREFYRICYPERDRPILLLAGKELPVMDLSENGACCLSNAMLFDRPSAIPVQVLLSDGTKISTTATFVRQEPDRLAVQFSPSISLPINFAEQRRLRRLYPDNEE